MRHSFVIILLMNVSLIPATRSIAQGPERLIADGAPITLEQKGLTITPPEGWVVDRDFPGTSLLARAPASAAAEYRRSIQIMAFNDPVYIDEMGANQFRGVIAKNFSKASALISDYIVHDPAPAELKSGVRGFIYYADFKLSGREMMQMHVLVSSEDRHFVVTYTDLKEYFSSSAVESDHLNEAWAAVGSIQLDSEGPTRFGLPLTLLLAAFSLTGLGFVVYKLRSVRGQKTYDDYSEGRNPDFGSDSTAIEEGPESFSRLGEMGTLHEGTMHEADALTGSDDIEFDGKNHGKVG